ncbi:hypothetical protein [Rhodopseudomonas palustris]|uniref:Uncharacterized protein n=1 Tax=Rhodopseudomonas palustris (strain ATCC BAA-98 / CGA009) TaxID=258594 RepID=Q6N7G1_RHOPA|nr:hypothetical protein [Rhodopseudomonas palustris]ACF01052.1 conserved hypothetical protein [Rhodopseudomonas palustris TIE-1]OPF90433.1 hypothetical protein B1S06_23995 [Rhodopseudomonas palustris]PPQ41488.1 hypothetical protein CKO39_22090 [Rhodopseudomonas palustris]QLH71326.1 hypothetical protein HZF03_11205 [Rhodopseudomonas palustris]QQM03817.1 hypothetical protein I8G32_02360 [Rhodopseudomonas palustris]
MTGASISALAALAGSAIGGLASLATAWLTQSHQEQTARIAQENTRRERIFGEFIDQASKLYVDALVNSLDDPTKMIGIYAVIGKLRLFAAAETIHEAERVIEAIVEIYFRPPVDLHDRKMLDVDKYDLLQPFAEACRRELFLASPARRPPTRTARAAY